MDKPYAALSNAVAAVQNGDMVKILPGYYTNTVRLHLWQSNSAPVQLRNRTNVWLDFTGSTFFLPSNFTSIAIINCSNVWIKGGVFDQQRSSWPYPQFMTNGIGSVFGVFEISDSYGVHISEATIANAWDHGWLVDSPTNQVATTNGSVTDCNFINCGGWGYLGAWDGDAIIPGAGWIISRNHIRDSNRGIEHYPIYAANGLPLKDLPAVVIKDNVVQNVFDHGICSYFGPALIEGNSVWTTNSIVAANQTGIQVFNSPGPSTVKGNSVHGFLYGIDVSTSTNVSVQNNDLYDCNYGMRAANAEALFIRNNNFVRCNYGIAMNDAAVYAANYGTIEGNTFRDVNGWATVTCNKVLQSMVIQNNNFLNRSNTGGFGIWLTGNQTNNVFRDNRFYGYATNQLISFTPPWVGGTNAGIMWHSNNAVFWTFTSGGTGTNHMLIGGILSPNEAHSSVWITNAMDHTEASIYTANSAATNCLLNFTNHYARLLCGTNFLNLINTNQPAANVRKLTVLIENYMGSNCTIAQTAAWKWLNYAPANPLTITNGKVYLLELTTRGSSATNIFAELKSQP